MHEAAHWRLFPAGRLNTWVGTWLCAAPMGEDLARYRRRHHLHHRHTLEPDDPELGSPASVADPGRELWPALIRDLAGVTACALLMRGRPWRDGMAGAWRRWRAPLAANAALAATLAAVGRWDLYLLLWVLPWATWYQLITRVRALAEHGRVPDASDPLRNARTIGAGPLARAVLAPYWVNHHLEHHLLVFVPCWKLGQVRALLLAKSLGDRIEMASSYAEVIRRAARAGAGSRAMPDGAASPSARARRA
jgi:fatty acid desaturase